LIGGAVVVLALWRAVRAYRNGRPLAASAIVGAAGIVFSPVSWTHHQIWLVIAAFAAVSARPDRNLLWTATALSIMTFPITAVGAGLPWEAVFRDARLWLAVAVAVGIPFLAVRDAADPRPPDEIGQLERRPRAGRR